MLELPTDQELKYRGEAILAGLEEGINGGCKLNHLAVLHRLDRSTHEDFLLVELGIKPVASLLQTVVATYRESGFLSYIPQEEALGFPYFFALDVGIAWNPAMVSNILEKQSALLARMIAEVPSLARVRRNPNDPAFFEFTYLLARQDRTITKMLLEANLYNLPTAPAERCIRFYDRLRMANTITTARGVELPPYVTPADIEEDTNSMKSRLLRAYRQAKALTPGLELDIKTARPAKVPGFTYSTFGTLTNKDEDQLRKAYRSSGVPQGVERILEG
jgi:hypothetical protein